MQSYQYLSKQCIA